MSPRLGEEEQARVWEEARGLCFSPQEGSRAEETISPSAPPPAAASSSLSTHPLHQALRVLSPFSVRVSHHHHHCSPPALHHDSLCHWPRCRAAHPRTCLPTPASLCTKRDCGEGLCPRYVGSPLPSSSQGPGLLSLLSPGDRPWWAGVGGRELPSPSPRKPLKNVYMPNRM